MNEVDLAILVVLAISVIVSLFRGFIKEVFSLLVWIAAFFAASQFSGALAQGLEPYIEVPSARMILAFVAVFLLVLVAGGLLTYLLGKLVEHTGLSATDRLFGSLFGLLRGLIIVLVAVLLARFTPFPQDPWWQESELLPRFEQMADWATGFLPPVMQEFLDQHQTSDSDSEVDFESQPEPLNPIELTSSFDRILPKEHA
ncbi:MAG: CvpA family protein [Pseudomonadota bacterium]